MTETSINELGKRVTGKENNPKDENFELASGTVPNEVISQLWPRLDRTCQFSRGNSESNDYFAPPLSQRGAHDTNAVSLRSDSNQCFTNFEARSTRSGNAPVVPPRDTSHSRPDVCQSQLKQVFSSYRNVSDPKLVPDLDVRSVPEFENYDTFMAGMSSNYSLRCDRNDSIRSTQSQRAVDTLVSNAPAAIGTTATFLNPLEPVFATGLRAISSCNISDKFTSSHLPVSNDVLFRRSLGTTAVDQKPRISEQYPMNSSRVMTASPGYIQNNLSGRRPVLDVVSPKSTRQPTSLPHKAIPNLITRNISKCNTIPPESNIFNQHCGDKTNNAFIYCAPSPPPTSSLVTADQLSPVTSFFGADHSALVSSNPNSYQPHPFVRLSDIGTTATQPSIQSSRNTVRMCRPNMPSISNYSAPHHPSIFSEGAANEMKNGLKQLTPVSALISHSSISGLFPSPRMLENSFESPSNKHPHGTNAVTLQCPASHSLVHSHPDMSTLIPSQNSSIVNSGCDEIFMASGGKVNEKEHSHALGEKNDTISRRSNIEAGRHVQTPVSVPQLKLCESYPSPRVTVVNQEPITPQQSGCQSAANCGYNEVATYSAPTARPGFDFPPGFPQFGGGDENAFPSVKTRWISTNVQDENFSMPDQVSGVRQSSGPPFES